MDEDTKKPLIRQAGSAEAFLDSTATGREHSYFSFCIGNVNPMVERFLVRPDQ